MQNIIKYDIIIKIGFTTLVLIIALLVSSLGTVSAATPLAVNEPAHGLMIQLSTLAPSVSIAKLKTMLNKIRTSHRNPANPGYIDTVVLQDIAKPSGALYTTYLNAITPFLPGGATPAFDRAYIGTVDLPWTGAGSKYIEGIKDAPFRNKNVNVSKTAANNFKVRYPTIVADWYITYEANMSGFWDSNIETSYLAYINQLSAGLSTVRPSKTFLWSPAFWTPLRNQPPWALPDLQTNIADISNKINVPLVLDIQDFVGQSQGASTRLDADAWMDYLKVNWKASTTIAPTVFQINAEQFQINDSGAIVAGDPIEVPERENYYAGEGHKVGPSWEIRYWYERLYGI